MAIINHMRVKASKLKQMTLFQKIQLFEFSKKRFHYLNNCEDPEDIYWCELCNVLEDLISEEILAKYIDKENY